MVLKEKEDPKGRKERKVKGRLFLLVLEVIIDILQWVWNVTYIVFIFPFTISIHPFFVSLIIEIDLGRNSKGDTKVYKVRCHKKCGSVSISLRTGRGDADLYGKEESPPIISDSNCNSCTLCKSRDSDLTDQCLVTTISKYLVMQCTEVLFFIIHARWRFQKWAEKKTSFSGLDSFYLAVHAHKSYHDGVLKVDGPNFMTIELDRGDSVIHDDGDVWFHTCLMKFQLPLHNIEIVLRDDLSIIGCWFWECK